MKTGKNSKLRFLRRTQKGRGKISLCLFLSALLVLLCACGGSAAPSTAPASPAPAPRNAAPAPGGFTEVDDDELPF